MRNANATTKCGTAGLPKYLPEKLDFLAAQCIRAAKERAMTRACLQHGRKIEIAWLRTTGVDWMRALDISPSIIADCLAWCETVRRGEYQRPATDKTTSID